MVTVTLILPMHRLDLMAHFCYKDRLKALPGAMFNPDTKSWTIPVSSIGYLEQDFQGELFYKTPKWRILNQSPPDYSKLYKLSTNITIPGLKLQLYDYQIYGVKFIIDRLVNYGICLLSDDVGLGKTAQAIAAMKWMINNYKYNKILLVVKKSVKTQWRDEFCKFTDLDKTFAIEVTGDTPKKRKKAYDVIKDAKNGILITSYHNFLTDKDYIGYIGFDMSCIDEVHQVSGKDGKINNAISYICAGKPCLMLTGTPIMQQPENIFGITKIGNPKYFGTYKSFESRYLVKQQTKYGIQVIGAKNLDELRFKIQAIVLRRTEKEVSVSLPKTVEKRISCICDNTQKKIIEQIAEAEDEYSYKMYELKQSGLNTPEAQEKYQRLEDTSKGLIAAKQAVANDPRLFYMTSSKFLKKKFGDLIPNNYKMSDKSEQILTLVQEIVGSGNKVILFSKFRTAALLAKEDIEKNLKYPVLMYTGNEGQDERDRSTKLFRETTTNNILIGTEALSEGVNLAEARYVIHIDQPDTYAIKTQRIGRSRRVSSQYGSIFTYDLITDNSKDVNALANIENNVQLTNALINLTDEQSKAIVEAMK